jgi:two-component system, cell cycle sensor histidine kinase and response regulator CckA
MSNEESRQPGPLRLSTRLEDGVIGEIQDLLPLCLLENATDAVIAQTVDGDIASWNPAATRLLGYTAEEIEGEPFSVLLWPGAVPGLLQLLKTIGEGQSGGGFDTVRICKDGSRKDTSIVLTPMKTSSGSVIGVMGVLRDIEGRKQSEARLWDSEEQFRELALHIRQVFWMMDDTETKVRYISPAYEKVWGRTCQSFFENPASFLDAVHPLDRDRVIRASAGKHQTGKFEEEYRILLPDGSARWIWDRGYPVHDPSGRVKGFVGIAEDITERRAIEDDRARLAAIVEFSDDAIVSKTLNGIVISWNPGAEQLYGYAAEEMIGRPISVLFTPEHYQEYLGIMEKVTGGKQIQAYDTVRRRKDGTMIHVSVSITPIEVRDGEIVGASKIAHDITRMKQLEEQFHEARKMETVGRLAAGLTHDFNNYLTIISSSSETLLNSIPEGDAMREMVLAIKKAGEQAATLTRQLLALSRKQILVPKELNLNEVLAESLTVLQRLAGETIDLSTVLDPALGSVNTDPSQIDQVLMNLVANARDAMPDGGRIQIVTANVLLDQTYCRSHRGVRPGRYIMLEMIDTGCGIDVQILGQIFEPFITTKDPGKGTGLGLAMIHGFITQSNGHVEVRSEPGLGSTFRVYLPEFQSIRPQEAVPSGGRVN